VREIETQEEEKKKVESELEDANLIIEELKEGISDLQEQLKEL
jgi:predicted  nucleic acid-binding Zn-ribbon protein